MSVATRPRPRPARSPRRIERTLEIGGLPIYASVEGEGRPLLLINGLGGSVPVWKPLRRRLHGFRTIAYDAPGAGRSPSSVLPMSVPRVAALTGRLCDELGYEQVDVLGYSLGGLVAAHMAWSAPERVRRLALMSTNTGWGSLPANPKTFGMLFSLRRFTDPEYYAEIAPDLVGGRLRHDPELRRQLGRERVADAPDMRGYIWQLLSCFTWSTAPMLPFIRQPTLVVNGDDDPLARPFNARWMAKVIPRGRLHLVEGGGHHLVLERPGEVAAVLREFYDG